MLIALKVISRLLKIVDNKLKYRTYFAIVIAILASFFDYFFYVLIANFSIVKNLNLPLGFNFSPFILISLFIILISLLRILSLYLNVSISASIGNFLHLSYLYSVLNKPFEVFRSQEKSFYIDKLNKHVEYATSCFLFSLNFFSTLLIVIATLFFVSFNISSINLFLIFLGGILYLVLSRFVGNRVKDNSNSYKSYLKNVISYDNHILSSYINIFFRQSHYSEIDKLSNLTKRCYRKGNMIAFYPLFPKNIVEPLIIIFLVISLLQNQNFTFNANNSAVVISSIRGLSVIQTLFYAWANIKAYLPFLNSITDDIDLVYESNQLTNLENGLDSHGSDRKNYQKADKNIIKVNSIYFRNNPNEYLFEKSTLTIPEGLTIIEGKNGVGKSTFFNIITGLLKPEKGEVFIEDFQIWPLPTKTQDLKDRKRILKKISYLTQDTYIYIGSILENITGKKDFSEVDLPFLKNLVKILDLEKLVGKDLSNSRRLCGDDGSKLSGGQKQRVALARELYRKPRIIFMDESLNAIEKKNQKIILKKIVSLNFISSVILITHDKLDWKENASFIEITTNGKLILKKNKNLI